MHELLTQLLTYGRGMWQFRWYALLVAWVVCLAGWTAVYTLPDEYEVRARVYVDTQSVLKPLLRGLAVEQDVGTRVNMMTRILLSRPNLEKVARETDLDLRASTPKEHEALMSKLQNNIKMKGEGGSRRRNDNLYTISYVDRDPQLAQRVVQTLLNAFVEDTLGSSRVDTAAAQRFLDKQIQEYEVRLTEAEQRLAEFKKEHVGMMPDDKGDFYARLRATQDQLEQTRTALVATSNRRDELRKQLQEQASQQGSTELDAEIKERRKELGTLLLKYTDQHPDVLALREMVAQLERRKENEKKEQKDFPASMDRIYESIKISLGAADAEAATLHAQVADQQRKVRELQTTVEKVPEVEAKLSRLNRDYSVTNTRYESLLQRFESARLSEQAAQSSDDIKFRIIDPPIVPREPTGPNRLRFATMVLFAGFVVAAALAFLLHDTRPTFLTAKSLRDVTGLPVLGTVSMKWQPKQLFRLRVEFASFVIVALLLVATYGGVILFEDAGVRLTQSLIRMI